jgi:hypothetical protein
MLENKNSVSVFQYLFFFKMWGISPEFALFIYGLFNDNVTLPDSMASNDMKMTEWSITKNKEGNGRG